MIVHPVAHFRIGEYRPQFLHRRERHAGAGDAKGQLRIAGGKIHLAGERDANIDIGDIALLQSEPPLLWIDAGPHLDGIEDQRPAALVHAEHDGASRHGHVPLPATRARRLNMREEREPVAAGDNLEWHQQHAAHRIPFQIEFGAVDGKR